MGHLWTLIEAYLERQGGMSQAALGRKMGDVSAQTVGSWKNRCSRPNPEMLRRLAKAIETDYRVVVAAADADAGYYTDPELDEVLEGARISDDLRQRIRAHAAEPIREPRRRLRKAE